MMHEPLVFSIKSVSPEEELVVLPHLIHLLQDTVTNELRLAFYRP